MCACQKNPSPASSLQNLRSCIFLKIISFTYFVLTYRICHCTELSAICNKLQTSNNAISISYLCTVVRRRHMRRQRRAFLLGVVAMPNVSCGRSVSLKAPARNDTSRTSRAKLPQKVRTKAKKFPSSKSKRNSAKLKLLNQLIIKKKNSDRSSRFFFVVVLLWCLIERTIFCTRIIPEIISSVSFFSYDF